MLKQKWEFQQSNRKYLKVTKRNQKAKKYNTWNLKEVFNNRLDQVEERINEFKYRIVEHIQLE